MTVTVSKEVQFDAGHRVPNHVSKCRHPHGHRYRVRVHCEGPVNTNPDDPEFGMVVDFGIIGEALRHVHDAWDHTMLVAHTDFELREALAGHDWAVVVLPFVPTAENLARDIHDRVADELETTDLHVTRVDVWETPTSLATYQP